MLLKLISRRIGKEFRGRAFSPVMTLLKITAMMGESLRGDSFTNSKYRNITRMPMSSRRAKVPALN
jgi:hypothetical protein